MNSALYSRNRMAHRTHIGSRKGIKICALALLLAIAVTTPAQTIRGKTRYKVIETDASLSASMSVDAQIVNGNPSGTIRIWFNSKYPLYYYGGDLIHEHGSYDLNVTALVIVGNEAWLTATGRDQYGAIQNVSLDIVDNGNKGDLINGSAVEFGNFSVTGGGNLRSRFNPYYIIGPTKHPNHGHGGGGGGAHID